MTDTINVLTVVVLVGFLVALGFLIVLLYRANRIVYRVEHLGATFGEFVKHAIPALLNFGTIANAVQAILEQLSEKPRQERSQKASPKK